ncbi:MAG: O-methyltransferase [Desulfobacterales bacterium]|jgi:caffeoyl-CoA O-methyltransferase|nr:MAG: O-methyltransferase [Desulfobacterales bacterium]
MSNIVANPEKYFRQFIPDRDSLWIELEAEAQHEKIPIVGPVVGELLFILARTSQSKKILELGTATGYSAIYLAKACEMFKGKVVTLENDRDMAARARQNIQKAGLEDSVEIRVGDALAEIAKSDEIFDFIFMDIEKEDYIRALSDCQRLLKRGGLLVADNVGFKDADEFNQSISTNPEWRPVSFFAYLPLHSPENDGLCIALRQ